ncbi:MAG: pyridoxal phosphate-dependent aminotransferase [Bifidobacteriaceae bacterium]|jgi:cystathionine beta-lyase|nr:pyridoxal phosphate-dependent aminotransferase [Bifidobacteriaceae bacterium]
MTGGGGGLTPFDRVIDRSGTGALALDRHGHGVPADALPLWVADMNFATPPPVREALAARVEHGIVGYGVPTDGYYEAMAGWFERRHGWSVDPQSAVMTRGVVHGLYLAVEALTRPGDGVIIQSPVYPPFFDVARAAGRRILVNPLVEGPDGYEIDFDGFAGAAREATAFILCSPHNPVGRVWSRGELGRLAEICLRHGVWLISDEVHADFVYPGRRHVVTATLGDEVDAITVTCTAPSKTFNLAGLQLAHLFASDPAVRRRLVASYAAQGLSQHPALGLVACEAAYAGAADSWVDDLVSYLDGNMALLEAGIADRLTGVRFRRPEGTYLAWLDFREWGLDAAALQRKLLMEARLWLSDGVTFGPDGAGFQRLNTAAPRAVLADALTRLTHISH